MTTTKRETLPVPVRRTGTDLEKDNEQLMFGIESLLVDMATDKWVNDLKPADMKPDVHAALAGMFLGYTVRARNLHARMVELAAAVAKAGKTRQP